MAPISGSPTAERRLELLRQQLHQRAGNAGTARESPPRGAAAASGAATAADVPDRLQAAPPAVPVLLDDTAMRRFVRDGYVTLQPQLSARYHATVCKRLDAVLARGTPAWSGGNPGNNLLPRVPQLMELLRHPRVHGALQSLLGHDYCMHMHRHLHDRHGVDENPAAVHHMHKDALVNSRHCADAKRRQHRPRMLMLMYFPQDTPVGLAPSGNFILTRNCV
jgi:hypothetical protein